MRFKIAAPFLLFSFACSGGIDRIEYTVSYRNQIRLPKDGQMLAAAKFSAQIKDKDPIRPIRCLAEESAAFTALADDLGGVEWKQPVAILKDASFPPLYRGKRDFRGWASGMAPSAEDGSSATPTIERPDLVGIQGNAAIFLSKSHGLLAVRTDTDPPSVTCSLKLPGDPKNFFYKGDEVVILVNGRGTQRSALLRFKFLGDSFRFVDGVKLEDQTIQDARLFDNTLVIYSLWTKEEPVQPMPLVNALAASNVAMPPMLWSAPRGVKLVTVQWDASLGVDWEETFTNGRRRPDWDESIPGDQYVTDPLMGQNPATAWNLGDVISVSRNYNSFLSASDRYVVVSRNVNRTLFDGMRTETYSYCSQYNPNYRQVEYCAPVYERRANPDYVAPSSTGDYSCGGLTLAACLAQAAPKVSQFIWARLRQDCRMVWEGRCEAYSTVTYTYPVYREEPVIEFAVYRFENGSFTKLDGALAQLDPSTGTAPGAIKFNRLPLSVPGKVANKDELQFQNGMFYVVAGEMLHALVITGNSIALARTLPLRSGIYSDPAVAFTPDRLLISAPYWNYSVSAMASRVSMFDLSEPSLPVALNFFNMPGVSSQLLLAQTGILGPGTVTIRGSASPSGDTILPDRTFEKLTLFSRTDGSESDNLLLGTEYDSFETSWFTSDDDQRIRLEAASQRLFLPYAGKHHADTYAPTAHRLNITNVSTGRLVSERSFDVNEDILRTSSVDTDRALAFGDSSVQFLDHRGGDWLMTTLRELFVPFATYRLNDWDTYARIDRLGSECRLTTHIGSDQVMEGESLAESRIPCPEYGLPVGFKNNVLFAETLTGWSVAGDGRKIETLDADQVRKLLDQIPYSDYCMIEPDNTTDASPIDYLDTVPDVIVCEPVSGDPVSTGSAVGEPVPAPSAN